MKVESELKCKPFGLFIPLLQQEIIDSSVYPCVFMWPGACTLFASFCVLCILQLSLADDVPPAAGQAHLLDVPPRFMWGWGPGVSGYCGSSSIQTVALYFGNWLTQDAVRGSTGRHDASHEIMLGDSKCCSGAVAARHFHLRVSQWKHHGEPQPQHQAFVHWVKQAVDAKQPVVFGVYMTDENSSEFDHIVPLVGYDSTGIYFNDLYFNRTLRAELSGFVKSRGECRSVPEHAGVQSYCLPPSINYGFKVLGNVDPNGELKRLRLDMNLNYEPDYSAEDKKHELPVILSASVVASDLLPGKRYALLRYFSPDDLPQDGQFLEKYTATTGLQPEYFVAPSKGTWRREVTLASNSTTFFRCVQARDLSFDSDETVSIFT
eukprot:TRINITY_DN16864_c0_g1_i1.p1 TRINITY_DN16864_c0_g1~~TRINITY_DN16864_c0_g1_i1.p1  ORF type:complete len:377 (+),score=55.12 TRINITY_DN16864_c0_g1_i1:10-1140(+)